MSTYDFGLTEQLGHRNAPVIVQALVLVQHAACQDQLGLYAVVFLRIREIAFSAHDVHSCACRASFDALDVHERPGASLLMLDKPAGAREYIVLRNLAAEI